jgi:hypothetical protein
MSREIWTNLRVELTLPLRVPDGETTQEHVEYVAERISEALNVEFPAAGTAKGDYAMGDFSMAFGPREVVSVNGGAAVPVDVEASALAELEGLRRVAGKKALPALDEAIGILREAASREAVAA